MSSLLRLKCCCGPVPCSQFDYASLPTSYVATFNYTAGVCINFFDGTPQLFREKTETLSVTLSRTSAVFGSGASYASAFTINRYINQVRLALRCAEHNDPCRSHVAAAVDFNTFDEGKFYYQYNYQWFAFAPEVKRFLPVGTFQPDRFTSDSFDMFGKPVYCDANGSPIYTPFVEPPRCMVPGPGLTDYAVTVDGHAGRGRGWGRVNSFSIS